MALNTEDRIVVEKELLPLNLGELNFERERIDSRIQHLQNELSDLAFHNYHTYVDVGRTAEHCKEMFVEMNGFMQQLRHEIPTLTEHIKQFKNGSQHIFKEYKELDTVGSTNNFIWQILKLPKLMDKCIRAGHYEQAYALTNFAMQLKQNKLAENPMLKNVVDVLLEARHNLLDELFNKFVGPIDLARSIQIVNNIRKIPYISNTQLRVSILQYRDIYMEKNVLRIMSEPDVLLRIIDIYRECMYDTIVLYLAVFPDSDIHRKFHSMNEDPRWERWTGSSQTYLLQSWAQHNIDKLFQFIRGIENKNCLDIEAMQSKLMSFAFSFGRMGLDFRQLIVHEFSQIVMEMFRRKVETATNCLIELQKLDLIDGDIFENTRQDIEDKTHQRSHVDLGILSAPLELCIWDDICVFGNFLIDALNEIRHSLSVVIARRIYSLLQLSLQNVFKWVDSFLNQAEHVELAKRAINLLLRHFVPFVNHCFFHCFPYHHFDKFLRSSHFSLQDFRTKFNLLSKELFILCKHDGMLIETLEQVLVQEEFNKQEEIEKEKDEESGKEMNDMEGESKVEDREEEKEQKEEGGEEVHEEQVAIQRGEEGEIHGNLD